MIHVEATPNDLTLRSFQRHLGLKNLAPHTIETYLKAVRLMGRWLEGVPLTSVSKAHVESYVAHLQRSTAPATVANRFRSLQQFFKWLSAEEELPNPMDTIPRPALPDVPVEVVADRNIHALLASCAGKSFMDRRDMAILRLFLDCGVRLEELSTLLVDSVDFYADTVLVMGKGRRPRTVPFDAKTAQALERYLRVRGQHADAERKELWLGKRGPLSGSGIAQMLKKRSRSVGSHIHPHQLRHTSAHLHAKAGMSETDLMRTFGWKSDQMPKRYGASAADERARDHKRQLGIGNSF